MLRLIDPDLCIFPGILRKSSFSAQMLEESYLIRKVVPDLRKESRDRPAFLEDDPIDIRAELPEKVLRGFEW